MSLETIIATLTEDEKKVIRELRGKKSDEIITIKKSGRLGFMKKFPELTSALFNGTLTDLIGDELPADSADVQDPPLTEEKPTDDAESKTNSGDKPSEEVSDPTPGDAELPPDPPEIDLKDLGAVKAEMERLREINVTSAKRIIDKDTLIRSRQDTLDRQNAERGQLIQHQKDMETRLTDAEAKLKDTGELPAGAETTGDAQIVIPELPTDAYDEHYQEKMATYNKAIGAAFNQQDAKNRDLIRINKQLGETVDSLKNHMGRQVESDEKNQKDKALNDIFAEMKEIQAADAGKFKTSRDIRDIDSDFSKFTNDPEALNQLVTPEDQAVYKELVEFINKTWILSEEKGVYEKYGKFKSAKEAYLWDKFQKGETINKPKPAGSKEQNAIEHGKAIADANAEKSDTAITLPNDALGEGDLLNTMNKDKRRKRFDELMKLGGTAIKTNAKLLDEWNALSQEFGFKPSKKSKPIVNRRELSNV